MRVCIEAAAQEVFGAIRFVCKSGWRTGRSLCLVLISLNSSFLWRCHEVNISTCFWPMFHRKLSVASVSGGFTIRYFTCTRSGARGHWLPQQRVTFCPIHTAAPDQGGMLKVVHYWGATSNMYTKYIMLNAIAVDCIASERISNRWHSTNMGSLLKFKQFITTSFNGELSLLSSWCQ